MSEIHCVDVLVVGATPGGIACAIRAAREGLSVFIAEWSNHVGGMWTSGLQGLDTRYAGLRCPVLTEFVQRIQDHYRKTFGATSKEFASACFGDPTIHGQRPKFEPHVAERVLREMLAEHPNIKLLHGCYPGQVTTNNKVISQVDLVSHGQQSPLQVKASVYVDATYVADLAAAAGASYRIGREDRSEFNEPHAGRYWSTLEPIGDVGVEQSERMHLHFFNRTSRKQFDQNTGKGDRAIQGYALRMTLTNDPKNRIAIQKPDGYDRQKYLGMLDRSADAWQKNYPLSSHFLHGDVNRMRINVSLPNGKADWLGVNFVGQNHAYPEADWQQRQVMYREHANHSLGALYFLQNDQDISVETREAMGVWGLPRDEYADTDHLPWMIYVREGRRLRGVHTFTEHDASKHPLHHRSPIHADAVAFAEWPMDSHDCQPVRVDGSLNDGEFILAEETLPSQIPYRCMITDEIENLIVPVCMSSTHVGWGTLRLEPVFVHTGEVAGVAAAMSVQQGIHVRHLNPSQLQQQLLESNVVISYLSDIRLGDAADTAQAALQRMSTLGFFDDYAANPDQPITYALAATWQSLLDCILTCDTFDPNEHAQQVCKILANEQAAFIAKPSHQAPPTSSPLGWDQHQNITARDVAPYIIEQIDGCLRS